MGCDNGTSGERTQAGMENGIRNASEKNERMITDFEGMEEMKSY